MSKNICENMFNSKNLNNLLMEKSTVNIIYKTIYYDKCLFAASFFKRKGTQSYQISKSESFFFCEI